MAVTAEAIPLHRLVREVPHLAEVLGDVATTASLARFAGMARPAMVDGPFVVGTASGAILPTFTAAADRPARDEVGLMGPVSVSLSLQRLCTVTVQVDTGSVVQEASAIGGLKRLADWYPFESGASVTVTNLSSNFYVAGLVIFPVWYLRAGLAERIRQALRDVLQ